jgi:putative nucleotidyltransferase with HDIG domain
MASRIVEFVRRTGDLPSVPAVVAKVIEVSENPNAPADDLRAVLERDPALAARILKVANSSLFAFPRRIETLSHAIALLGFRSIRNLALGASMKEVFTRFGLTERMLWEHATCAGAVAAKLTDHPSIEVDREEAFTVGLLHDLGKIALNNVAPEEYAKVVARVYNDNVSFVTAELEILGFEHAEFGAQVAEKWRMGPRLVHAIRLHHTPEALEILPVEECRLTALATVTTTLCTRLGVGRREPVESLDPTTLPAWSAVGLGPDDLESVLLLTTEVLKDSESLFK